MGFQGFRFVIYMSYSRKKLLLTKQKQEYDPETHIALMDRLNVSKSIISASSPGTNLSPGNATQAREFTRQVNIEMAELCKKYPDRFEFFASLPLPDVAGALEEIDYALYTLHAVGFQILSNSNGVYPGDPELNSVFEKLNKRKAIVFFHPTSCHITIGEGEAATVEVVNPQPRLVRPMMEFMFDSTRAVANLLLSGTAQRCSDITFVVCHCGAALAPLFERIVGFSKLMRAGGITLTVKEATAVIQNRFYFDLAGFPFPTQIQGLLQLTNSSRLLYGSDYPFTPGPVVESMATGMDQELAKLFSKEEQAMVYYGNARTLLNGK
jgi:6-methylsalicylate decarboxylase